MKRFSEGGGHHHTTVNANSNQVLNFSNALINLTQSHGSLSPRIEGGVNGSFYSGNRE